MNLYSAQVNTLLQMSVVLQWPLRLCDMHYVNVEMSFYLNWLSTAAHETQPTPLDQRWKTAANGTR